MSSSQTDEKPSPGRGRRRGTGSVYRPRDPKDGSRHIQTWWIAYYVNGKRYRESSRSRNRSDAGALLKRRLGEHATGQFIGSESGRLTFEDLEVGIVTSYELAGRRSLDRLKAAFGHLRERFGGMRALDITPSRLQTYAVERSKEGAPATVQYEMALPRRAFTLAVQQGRLPSRPAFPQIRVNNARIGFFSSAEFEAVVQELPTPLKNVAVFGYYTGWRKSEILGLTWGAVDLENGIARLEPTSSVAGTSTKNDDGRTFPVGVLPQLATALRNQRAYTDDVQRRTGQIVPWVFHREGKQIKKLDEAWRAACERAKVPSKLFHDFRRTSARNLIRAGVPEHWAMRLTGHKTTEVFRRYAITSESDLRDAVSRLAAAMPDQTVRLLRTATV